MPYCPTADSKSILESLQHNTAPEEDEEEDVHSGSLLVEIDMEDEDIEILN